MPRSLHHGFVKTQPAAYGSASSVDTSTYRDVVLNGAIHVDDMSGQVRVNWGSFAVPELTDPYFLQPDTFTGDNDWAMIVNYGPWPMTIGQYLRVRCKGYTADVTCKFRFALIEHPDIGRFLGGEVHEIGLLPSCDFTTIGSGADADQWLDTTAGSPDYSLVIGRNVTTAPLTTARDVSSSNVTAVDVALRYLCIFANHEDARLTGVYAAEYMP